MADDKDIYITLDFIKDLIYDLKIPHNELSILFGKNSRYLDEIKQRIRNPKHPKYNPDFKFSHDNLEILRENLIIRYGEGSTKPLYYVDRYLNLNNDLKEYAGQQYHLYHLNLNGHFFEKIDNKTKAYWLGFLCADGYINKTRYGRLGIHLSIKDKKHLIKFCEAIGLEPSFVKEREEIKLYNGKLVKYRTVYIDFWCKPIYEDLVRHDFKKFPKLISFELYLAWLLGLYDGDGFQGKTMVCSASKKLLEKIRNYFDIKFEVREYYYDSDLGYHKRSNEDIEIKYSSRFIYILTLGAQLFNKMMRNYSDSLKRKRKIYKEFNNS